MLKLFWLVLAASLCSFLIGMELKNSLPPAYAQGTGSTSHEYCYTQRYNFDGTKRGNPDWFPCDAGAPLWTMNQAQRSVNLNPVNGVLFEPTKALLVNDNAACDASLRLIGDTAYKVWHLQPGYQPLQVISADSFGTTCVSIYRLY